MGEQGEKMTNCRHILSAMATSILLVTATFATGQAFGQPAIAVVYRAEAEESRLELKDAEAIIQRTVKGPSAVTLWPATPEWSDFWPPSSVSTVTFQPDEVAFQQGNESLAPIRVRYEALATVHVIRKRRGLDLTILGVKVSPTLAFWIKPIAGPEPDTQTATAMARALHALYRLKIEEPQDEARFAESVAKYLSASTKPVLGEEARRYKVQAELLIREKRFAEAAGLYREALKVVPWWSEGRYNRALVLVELKRYREATWEMRRFLQLEPNVPEARLLQDRIYEWEILGKK